VWYTHGTDVQQDTAVGWTAVWHTHGTDVQQDTAIGWTALTTPW